MVGSARIFKYTPVRRKCLRTLVLKKRELNNLKRMNMNPFSERTKNYNCANDTLLCSVEVTMVFFICREFNASPLPSAAQDSMMGLTEVSGGIYSAQDTR